MRNITKSQIQEAILNNPISMRQAALYMGIPYQTFIFNAKRYGLYNPNPSRKGFVRDKKEYVNKTLSLEEILMGKHPQYPTNQLKKRLIATHTLPHLCSICGIRGEEIGLILDHINGISNDHRLENLRLVCPNCNSKLPTHAGRNKKLKRSLLLPEELIDLIFEGLTNQEIFERLNYSATGMNVRRVESLRKTIEYIRNKILGL